MGWNYEATHAEIAGDAKWRWFCCLYDHLVPHHSTLQTREELIRPTTLHRLNDRLVHLAEGQGVTQGKKLRTDSTVLKPTFTIQPTAVCSAIAPVSWDDCVMRRVTYCVRTRPRKRNIFGIIRGALNVWPAKLHNACVANRIKKT